MTNPDQQPDYEADVDQALADSEAALDDALNNLEELLENRQHLPGSGAKAAPEAGSGEAEIPGPDDFELQPDNIPMLDDIIVPGTGDKPQDRNVFPESEQSMLNESGEDGLSAALPQHNDLIARLVNEMNIIIESTVDNALTEAKKEIMAKLNNHLDIVLPEIVDELLRRCGEHHAADSED